MRMPVLNAIRRYRINHEAVAESVEGVKFVLNAIRRYRINHAPRESFGRPSLMCSTPLGVTG